MKLYEVKVQRRVTRIETTTILVGADSEQDVANELKLDPVWIEDSGFDYPEDGEDLDEKYGAWENTPMPMVSAKEVKSPAEIPCGWSDSCVYSGRYAGTMAMDYFDEEDGNRGD